MRSTEEIIEQIRDEIEQMQAEIKKSKIKLLLLENDLEEALMREEEETDEWRRGEADDAWIRTQKENAI